MNFRYYAIDKAGKPENGRMDADSESTAKNEIKNRGLYLVSLKEVSAGGRKRRMFFSFGIKQRLPIQLARQLASLLKGGVPLFQALTIIANQLEGDREKEIVGYLRDEVKGGASLSDALKAYPEIFDNLFVYSVSAGEKTGALHSILRYQADLLESRANVKAKIKAALVYPAIMCVVGTGVLLFLIGYVVPMVTKIFDRMNQQLPLPTRVLLSITAFVNSYLFVFAISLGLAIFAFSRWVKKTPRGRQFWDSLVLRFPMFGNLYQMVLIGRFAKIMGTLLKSGVHMLQSLVVVSSTMKNTIVSDAVMNMSRMVERGADLSIALKESSIFPSYVADMVSVGESSGNLEEMLTSVSDYYEANANQKIAAFTSMVEPLIIVILGAVIAFILVSILLPLFEMNKILTK
ncbi:MAG: type II secretion system F family protein [Syntrophorhabdales bacterium]|jgi:general secretion pathway protein F